MPEFQITDTYEFGNAIVVDVQSRQDDWYTVTMSTLKDDHTVLILPEPRNLTLAGDILRFLHNEGYDMEGQLPS